MALSGDLRREDSHQIPSIRYEKQIYFTDEGLVKDKDTDSTLHSLRDVIQVIEGDIKSVLPLIGYRKHEIKTLLEKDILSATHEVNQSLEKLCRSPDSHLLVHNNRLYGVVVNETNKSQIIGRITSVVPNKEHNNPLNVLIVEEEGLQTICSATDLDIKNLVEKGDILSMISVNGFAFIESNEISAEDMPSLVLVVNSGYILFKSLSIDWIRLQTGLKINEFEVKTTTILPNECIVSLRSGFVRDGQRIVVYGNQSGVLDFNSLLLFGKDLQTIRSESEQQTNGEDIEEFVKEIPDLLIDPQESDSTADSGESYDSQYDYLSPDSFS